MSWGVYRTWPGYYARRAPTPPLPSTAAKIIAAMTSAPSAGHAAAINTFVNALIAAGIWAKLDYLHVYRAQDSQAACLDWKNPTGGSTASLVNSPTFTAFLGYTTNGSTSEVDTNFNPSTTAGPSGQDSACFLVGHDGSNTTTGSVAGWYDGTDGITLSFRRTSDNLATGRANQASSISSAATVASAVGLYAINRSASNAVQFYRNGTSIQTGSNASTARNNNSLRLGRTQTAAYEIGTFGLSAYASSLNSTEQAAFSTAWDAFKTATTSTTYTLTAAAGSFALSGQPAGLVATRKLTAAQGAFALNGQAATLTYATGTYLPTLGTAPTGVGGLKKMVSGWAGNAVRVRRSSDNTEQNIGFSGNNLDVAAATTFAAGSTLYIRGIYDQTATATYVMAQATTGLQPILDLYESGEPRILFQNGQELAIDTAITANRQGFSTLSVCAQLTAVRNSNCFEFGSSTNQIGLAGLLSNVNSQPVVSGVTQTVTPTTGKTVGTGTPMIFGMVGSASVITVHRDGQTTTSSAAGSATFAGGKWGSQGGTQGRWDFQAFVFYPAALSGGDVTSLKAALASIWSTNSDTPTLNVAFQGDSKTEGSSGTARNLTISRTVYDSLVANGVPETIVRNFGISGHLIEDDKTGFLAGGGFIESGATKNVAVLYEGTNDIGGGYTDADVWADYQTWVASMRTNGWDKVICCTIPPIGVTAIYNSTQEGYRVALNNRIRANAGALFDGYADLDAIAAFGTAGSPNTTYFPDQLHETEGAYLLEAPVIASAIMAAAGLNRTLTAAQGALALSGQAAGLKRGLRLTAAAGSFALGGQAATLSKSGGYTLTAAMGSFALTGRAAGLARGRTLTAAAGAFALGGQPANLVPLRHIVFAAGVGSFALTGRTANLRLSTDTGWSPVPSLAETWTPVPSTAETWSAA